MFIFLNKEVIIRFNFLFDLIKILDFLQISSSHQTWMGLDVSVFSLASNHIEIYVFIVKNQKDIKCIHCSQYLCTNDHFQKHLRTLHREIIRSKSDEINDIESVFIN